jgi:hypothetical protein
MSVLGQKRNISQQPLYLRKQTSDQPTGSPLGCPLSARSRRAELKRCGRAFERSFEPARLLCLHQPAQRRMAQQAYAPLTFDKVMQTLSDHYATRAKAYRDGTGVDLMKSYI